ncbi:MAG: metal ABC transporter ATP-binding protein [Anaerovoracaceae bacterium]|jgi:zinc transport system ATP-binding protein
MNLITCKNISFVYDGVPAVKDVDFSVAENDYICIVGENGAGKSTLIRGLLRLKKPSSGSIIMENGLLASEIGYLPQQTAVQKDFPAGVSEVVLSGCLNRLGLRPFYTRKEKRLADENMHKLGIENLRERCYRELSGGQQQRVLLARALCAARKVILLDEPAAGLDPMVTRDLYGLICRINEDLGITIIMVSHDIQAAVHYAKHILHLHHSQLFFGTTGDYMKSKVGRHFIGGAIHA